MLKSCILGKKIRGEKVEVKKSTITKYNLNKILTENLTLIIALFDFKF